MRDTLWDGGSVADISMLYSFIQSFFICFISIKSVTYRKQSGQGSWILCEAGYKPDVDI